MDEHENNLEMLADSLLVGTGLSVLDAARLALELHETVSPRGVAGEVSIGTCRRVIQLGAAAFAQEGRTVCFRDAVEQSLLSRAGRRTRTLAEIRQCCRRLLRFRPDLADMPIRCINTELCRELIEGAYSTPPMRHKARRLLHGIFAFCLRNGWCSANPVAAIEVPHVLESPVEVLSLAQVRRLLATARRPEHRACAPAVGFMLWAGIRPTELTRLRWRDVHEADHVITIDARHAKTGGARQVTLYPVLIRWLRETAPFRLPQAFIVPCSWIIRWRNLRRAAGFSGWHPDALRHTFASYHLKHFADYNKLQIDMGHSDTLLLRTRYLGMRGITSEGAAEFWGKRRCAFSLESEPQQEV